MSLRARAVVVVLAVLTAFVIASPSASASGYAGVSVGAFHACASLPSGSVSCWGDGISGQLGDPSIQSSSSPLPVPGLTGAAAIASGSYHSCALLSSGGVRCWGSNGRGQLGNGSTVDPPGAVSVSGLADATAVTLGAFHSCALNASGGVVCWGRNDLGQLGNGTTTDASSPTPVAGLSAGVVAISAGAYHTCALLTAGTVRCWGYNAYAQLGDGSTSGTTTPIAVPSLSDVGSIAAGGLFTCAVTTAKDLFCWGDNTFGELGRPGGSSAAPALVGSLGGTVAVASAGAYHACAITTASRLACWGYNSAGQLGNGSIGGSTPTPALVTSLTGVTAVATGVEETCAIAAGGLHCFGSNDYGQLGNGTKGAPSADPVVVPFPDSSPPSVAVNGQDCATPGNDGWCRSAVRVTFVASDPSGVTTPCSGETCSFSAWTSGDGEALWVPSGDACDGVGNCGDGPQAGPFNVDTTPPAVACPSGQTFELGSLATLVAAVTDATSGATSPSASGDADTSSVGPHAVTIAASDVAGNTTTRSCGYSVVYRFGGFSGPRADGGMNDAKAGSAVPLAFSLSGNQGLGILAQNSPSVSAIDCQTGVATSAAVRADVGALSYDGASDTYSLRWKTDRSWTGTCRALDVALTDGTHHVLTYSFR